jgi:hypothetical protein
MRRALAVLLVLLISPPLIPALGFGSPEGKLPPCCRRDGKHGCAMKTGRKGEVPTSNVDIVAAPQCESYPPADATFAGPVLLVCPGPMLSTPVLGLAGAVSQTEARYRISFNRARQKRGPPARLS